jgi:hypothetical protein
MTGEGKVHQTLSACWMERVLSACVCFRMRLGSYCPAYITPDYDTGPGQYFKQS